MAGLTGGFCVVKKLLTDEDQLVCNLCYKKNRHLVDPPVHLVDTAAVDIGSADQHGHHSTLDALSLHPGSSMVPKAPSLYPGSSTVAKVGMPNNSKKQQEQQATPQLTTLTPSTKGAKPRKTPKPAAALKVVKVVQSDPNSSAIGTPKSAAVSTTPKSASSKEVPLNVGNSVP